jgi:hypothetical protein
MGRGATYGLNDGRIAMPFGGSKAGEPSNGKESLLTTRAITNATL